MIFTLSKIHNSIIFVNFIVGIIILGYVFTWSFVKKNERKEGGRKRRLHGNISNIGHVLFLVLVDFCIKLFYKNDKYTSHASVVTDKVQKCVISLEAKKYFLIANKKNPFIKSGLNI